MFTILIFMDMIYKQYKVLSIFYAVYFALKFKNHL